MYPTPPSDKIIELRKKILSILIEEMKTEPAIEILSMLAYTLGQVVAFQDQRTTTSAMALEIIQRNLEAGNKDAIDQTFKGAIRV